MRNRYKSEVDMAEDRRLRNIEELSDTQRTQSHGHDGMYTPEDHALAVAWLDGWLPVWRACKWEALKDSLVQLVKDVRTKGTAR